MCTRQGKQKNKIDRFLLFVPSSDAARNSSTHHTIPSLYRAIAIGPAIDTNPGQPSCDLCCLEQMDRLIQEDFLPTLEQGDMESSAIGSGLWT